MATHDTPASDSEDDVHGSTTQREISRFEQRSRDGSLATVAGGATLLWAARTVRKNAGRGALLALTGAALIGVGWHQRRGDPGEDAAESRITVSLDEDGDAEAAEQDRQQVSEDAHVQTSGDLGAGRNADESASGARSKGRAADVNPRGVAEGEALEQDDGGEDDGGEDDDGEDDDGEDDDGEDDDGDFDFVDGTDPATHPEPQLGEDVDGDPRLNEDENEAGEPTEIDLSEASMADESSEAAGPQPEQAFPSMEGTDPEPQSEQAPPRQNEGLESVAEPDGEDGEGLDADHESVDSNEETTGAGNDSTETDDDSAEAGNDSTETDDESSDRNGEAGETS